MSTMFFFIFINVSRVGVFSLLRGLVLVKLIKINRRSTSVVVCIIGSTAIKICLDAGSFQFLIYLADIMMEFWEGHKLESLRPATMLGACKIRSCLHLKCQFSRGLLNILFDFFIEGISQLEILSVVTVVVFRLNAVGNFQFTSFIEIRSRIRKPFCTKLLWTSSKTRILALYEGFPAVFCPLLVFWSRYFFYWNWLWNKRLNP